MRQYFTTAIFFFALSFGVWTQNPNQQTDTLSYSKVTRSIYFGGSITVPTGKVWSIQRVLVNNGNYNVLCCTEMKDKVFKSGEKIYAPSYSADAAMLSEDMSTMQFIFEIEEKKE